MGQPILVGHHSEKRDRNFRKPDSQQLLRKAFELKEKASRLRGRAASVGKAGVSSDDPDAVVKLIENLEELEKKQALYKAINKALRKADRTGSDEELKALGLSDKTIAELKTPDDAGEQGHPLLPAHQQQLEHAPDPPADRGAAGSRERPDERRAAR